MAGWIAKRITQILVASAVVKEDDTELYIYGFFMLVRTGLNYSVHNKVYESNYRVVRLTFQRLNPAAGGISTTYVWSADSSGSYNGAA